MDQDGKLFVRVSEEPAFNTQEMPMLLGNVRNGIAGNVVDGLATKGFRSFIERDLTGRYMDQIVLLDRVSNAQFDALSAEFIYGPDN